MRGIGIAMLGLAVVCICCTKNYGARARVHLIKDSLLTPSMLQVAVSDGRSTWCFESQDFGVDAMFAGAWSSAEMKTRTSGTLAIQFSFRDTLGQVVSQGEVAIPLRGDWRWSIDLFRASEDPIQKCFGCVDSRAFVILDSTFVGSKDDSVFVVWGGNFISDPVVY